MICWFYDENNKEHCISCDVDFKSAQLVNRRPSEYSPNHDILTFCTRVSRGQSITVKRNTKIPKGDFVVFFEVG